MTAADRGFRKFVDENAMQLVFIALFVISVLVRIDLAPKTDWSPDYLACIDPWVREYRSLGFVNGLATEIGNYYIPYNVILALISYAPTEPWVMISVISCVFEYLMFYFAYRLLLVIDGGEEDEDLSEARVGRAAFAALLMLFLPPMILNGAFWKQCDAIYGAFGVIALYHLMKDQYHRAFLFLSLAFVFKLQTILLFPVFIIAYFCGKRFSFLHWLWLPGMYLFTGLPAVLAGRPVKEVYSIYLDQSDEYHYMFMNTGGLYRLLRSDYDALSYAAVLCTVGVCGILFYITWKYRAVVGNARLLQLAGVAGYGCFLFLPAMHERYDYLPIFLVTLYYAYYHRKKLYIPGILVLVTAVMYCAYLFGGNTLPEEAYALLCLTGFWLALMDYIRELQTGAPVEEKVRREAVPEDNGPDESGEIEE
ncbi:MAG: hypothetical protein IK096_03730 [Lachnospiraceae bacterium]|nr:hypothetical protein [Lachnospiraceae bacterium]